VIVPYHHRRAQGTLLPRIHHLPGAASLKGPRRRSCVFSLRVALGSRSDSVNR